MAKPVTFPPGQYRSMGQVIRRQVLEMYKQDSCIATVRATIDALRKMHVDVYPLACKVIVVNEPVFRYAETHSEFPEVGADDYPVGGHAIGIGYGSTVERDDGWDGHLVAIAERRWMLDFSIDQASRPNHGIDLEPLVIPVTEPWLRGREGHLVYRHHDTWLYYEAMPRVTTFKLSPNWSGETAPSVTLRRRTT